MYDIKALYEAESVEHAVRLLTEHPEAQIIAGGSDVLVQMREGNYSENVLSRICGTLYQLCPAGRHGYCHDGLFGKCEAVGR